MIREFTVLFFDKKDCLLRKFNIFATRFEYFGAWRSRLAYPEWVREGSEL